LYFQSFFKITAKQTFAAHGKFILINLSIPALWVAQAWFREWCSILLGIDFQKTDYLFLISL